LGLGEANVNVFAKVGIADPAPYLVKAQPIPDGLPNQPRVLNEDSPDCCTLFRMPLRIIIRVFFTAMLALFFKRLAYGCSVLVGIITITFILFYTLPGDPTYLMTSTHASPEMRERIRIELGLDQPLWYQWVHYLSDLSPVSVYKNTPESRAKYRYLPVLSLSGYALVLKWPYLRHSFQTQKPVTQILREHLPGTLMLAFSALLLACLLAIPLAAFCAMHPGSWPDRTLLTVTTMGLTIPVFVVGIAMATLFGYVLGHYTGLEPTGSLWMTNFYGERQLVLKNLVLPACTLAIKPLATMFHIARNAMVETLAKDYIRTAQAKGLSRRQIFRQHVIKNSLNPVVTAASGWLVTLLGGAFFVEYIFNWKGIGLKTIQAIYTLDFPVLMGSMLAIGVIFILVNMATDLLQAWLDPRMKAA
jgi:peptide/nickel transport system permease protein